MKIFRRRFGSSATEADSSTATARPAVVLTGIVVLLAWIFLLDLLFPLGVAAGVPYITAVLLALWLESDRLRLGVAVAAGLLTIVGFFLPEPQGVSFWIGLENRLIALFAISVTAVLGHLLLAQTREVRDRERRLGAILSTAPDAILTVERDGNIESCNPAAGAMFGRRCAALVGTPIATLLPGFSGGAPPSCRIRALKAHRLDGSEFPAEVSISRFPQGGEQEELGPEHVAVVRDVTSLRDAQQRTLRAERLAAVGETLAVLSHEARNELLALRMGLAILADAPERLNADLISSLSSSERRLSRLFEDVRLHAGPIRLNPSPCRLSDVWRRAWAACDRSGRMAELVEHSPNQGAATGESPDEPAFLADGFRLEQVFRNLFENALSACHDPVQIEVRTESCGTADEPAIQVSVRDNGPGLSPEARRQAFEPFFTTKSDGTGLGLAICSRILEAHGGTLTLGDEDGPGAEFVLTLPRLGVNGAERLRELAEA